MRCCTNKLDLLSGVLWALGLWLCANIAHAEGIDIEKVDARLTEDGYQLSADFRINLPPPVEIALKRGVTLYFVSEFAINRSRWYWLDTDVVHSEQVTKLSYNALTQQYRLAHGSLFQSFYELGEALRVLGHQTAPPASTALLDKEGGGYFSRLLKKGSKCCAASVRMRLDVTQLPKPMQVNALTNNDWDLESRLYRWEIQAEQPVEEAQP